MRQIVLLRGINLGARNRVAMPQLRELLATAGFDDVRTYVQSGNVVVSSDDPPAEVARAVERQIRAGLELDIRVVVRTRDELANVVRLNPLGSVATDPKRYQVTFLAEALAAEVVRELEAVAVPPERFGARGRELYAWHPSGVARSKLWARLASRDLGVVATTRNWTTVTKLLELADE